METRANFRRFRGYAVLSGRDGPLVWGTFRPTEADARAAFERWNPAAGEAPAFDVCKVEIEIITH